MHPVDFSIRDDAVLALVRDGSLGGVWEQLRRNGRPTAASDIAASLGLQEGPAIAQLDRLVALGLAKRLPMSARRRQLRFEAISGQVIVRYRLPEDEELLQELVTSRVAHTLQAMPRTNGHDRTFGFVTRLTESEAQEVRRLLGSIADLLNGAASRKPSWRDGLGPPNHAVHLRLEPINEPALPTPHLLLAPVGQEVTGPSRPAAGSNGRDVLSPRERQIGAAYLRGLTRREIAAELGLSYNSVATFTKRLYTKLGIKRRGALAGRLAEVLGDRAPNTLPG
jgi:DNA-binding CsgD family transcriptional regulator/DNA-binding Lrp family transcriptional regulator